jgi:NitT/TauT family transport system substrate-binding protein
MDPLLVAGGIYFKSGFPRVAPSSPTASESPSYDTRILTIGIDSRPTGMLFYAVNHFIPSSKFRIQPVVIEDPNERWSRLKSGAVDMAFSTFPEFVLGSARHKPGKMLMYLSSSHGCDGIAVKGNINNIEELTGKKIAVVPGSAGHYFLVRALDSKAKSSSEVTLAPAPSMADVFGNFMTGDILDGAVLSEPYLSKSEENGRKILVSTRNFISMEEVLTASDFAIENRPADIQMVVNGYFNLVHLINTNPGLAKSLITKNSGKTVNEVDMLFSSVSFKDLNESRAISKEDVAGSMQKTQQIWGIEGLPNASVKIDFEKAIDYHFLEKASVDKLLFESAPQPNVESPSPEEGIDVSPSPSMTTDESSPSPSVSSDESSPSPSGSALPSPAESSK